MLDEMRVSAVSLNELSRRVGLAKSNALRYFESREAILLELLDRAWKAWLADLPEQLAAGVQPVASPPERAQQVAAAITASLVPRRTLCELLSAQAAVLEHNVSAEVAARYKRAALANVDTFAAQVLELLPELGDRAGQVCGMAIMAVGAVWTHSQPSEGMLAAYAVDPALAAARLDFASAAQEVLATLMTGALRIGPVHVDPDLTSPGARGPDGPAPPAAPEGHRGA